jgi:transposase
MRCAHHLRELKALIEIEKEDWAGAMQHLLRRACHAANLAAEPGIALDTLKPRLVELLERRYDAILVAGLAFHEAQPPLRSAAAGARQKRGRKPRRTGHNLLLRLLLRKQDVLRFLHDAAVPFTNNQAERDLRMTKVKQKISGGFRSEQGAIDFATIRSFISTAKKQGCNVIQALVQQPNTFIAALSTV